MPRLRSYRLHSPVARALDLVGDRWNLLILQELLARPCRFTDLLASLPGLASNLLTTRLEAMEEADLIRRNVGAHGVQLYQVTERGKEVGPTLDALARFGRTAPLPEGARSPGKLASVRGWLLALLIEADDQETSLEVELTLDDQVFWVSIAPGAMEVRPIPPPDAAVRVVTTLEALVGLLQGSLSPRQFAAKHAKVRKTSKDDALAFFRYLGRIAREGAA